MATEEKVQDSNYQYEHKTITDSRSYLKNLVPFISQSRQRIFPANRHISIMTRNQYTFLATVYARLFPEDFFPLKISRHILTGSAMERVKNIIMRKNSPLQELFSIIILQISQSGICTHFARVQTSIDFHINPNIRSAEEDWSQIITLNIAKVFFSVLLTAYLFAIVALTLESSSLKSHLRTCGMSARDSIRAVKRKHWYIAFIGTILSLICFVCLSFGSNAVSNEFSFGKCHSQYPSVR